MFSETVNMVVKKIKISRQRPEDGGGITPELTLRGLTDDQMLDDLGKDVRGLVEARRLAAAPPVLPFSSVVLNLQAADLALRIYDPDRSKTAQTINGVSATRVKLLSSQESQTHPEVEIRLQLPPATTEQIMALAELVEYDVAVDLVSQQAALFK